MDLLPKDTDLIISPLKDENEKKHKGFVEVNPQPLLYDLDTLDNATKRFDYYSPCQEDPDFLLKEQSPGLLALKNKAAKSNLKKPIITKPGLNNNPEQIRSYSTLITSKPMQPIPLGQNKLATKIKMEQELEQNGLNFDDDPIAYFFKHKDGSGHLFIYLIFEKPRSDLEFSPYQLKKVTHSELTAEFFTMSSNGVTHMYADGSSETIELDKWARFKTLFSSIKKLNFFKKYRFWKSFKLWKQFVKMQRYTVLRSKVLEKSWYNNQNFYLYLLMIMKETCEDILQENLLSIISQRKYKLSTYIEVTNEKTNNLISKYRSFIMQTVEKIKQLDAEIRDPQRTLVKQTDFQKNKAIIPNLGQLMVLNEKMNEEKAKRMKIVHKEIIEFGNFVRLIDYIELEYLSSACLKCWKNAESNIMQDMSAIFQVEIMFNEEGKIVFEPKLETLKKTISDSLDNTIQIIDSLPRILEMRELSPFLRETVGNISFMVNNRLRFSQCVKSNENYGIIKKNILDTIEKSYYEAERQSQKFSEFYNLYKLGRTWNAEDYLLERGGPENPFILTEYSSDFDREPEPIIFDPSKEIIVDFDKISEDVINLKKEELRINQFRSASVRGALFIDSKNLRAELTPIPVKSMQDIQSILHKVLQDKIEHINSVLRFASKRLKKEPSTLNEYTDNSEFLGKVIELNKSIKKEISFVDELMALIDRIGFSNRTGEHTRNPLYQVYRIFKQDLKTAINIKETNRDKFVKELSVEVNTVGRTLKSFQAQISSVPQDIFNSNIDHYIDKANNLKSKIQRIEPEVQNLQRCQEIMNVDIEDLSSFSNLKSSIEYIMQVYDLTKDWQIIANIITTVPFNEIDINKFGNDINNLNIRAKGLLEEKVFDSSLLNMIYEKITNILGFMDQLEQLSTSKMHFHHWSKLFEDCGQAKGYYAQIKIDEMITNGILQEKEKIESITSIALGESQLEKEFNELANEWKFVNLPICNSQIKSEDSLLLGDLTELYAKISDSQLKLQRMLTLPFVQGLSEQISNLSSQLDYYNKVLEAWSKFQASWVILASFFTPEDTKKSMQNEANKFMIVRRRWVNLVRHTLENTALFHVCSFASLLEMLIDNNNCLEQICSNVLKKIDCKRVQFPRLFFLSNTDVLTIFSTTDFPTMNRLMSKMFMHIKCFETHPLDETEIALQQSMSSQNFQRIKVYGMTGESEDTLVFTRNIVLGGSIDTWGPTMIDVMKQSVMTHISESIYKFTHSKLEDWITSVPIHIAIITLRITFSRDIEECFNNFENNVHSFDQYKEDIRDKIDRLGRMLKTDSFNDSASKVRSVITLLCYHVDKIDHLTVRKANYSSREYWATFPRLKFNHKTSQISIETTFSTWEHGYEFWGETRQMIMSPESDIASMNILSAISSSNYTLLFGDQSIGRKQLLSNIAALFGRFIYFSPSFSDKESVIFNRLLTGAIGSGSWIVFNNIDQADITNLSNATRSINLINSARANNATHISIDHNSINFSNNFNMFFIGGEKSQDTTAIPDSLKSALHMVAFQRPDFQKIAKINFMVNGFKSVDYLSKQIVEFIKLFKTLFNYISIKPVINDIISTTKIGFSIYKKLLSTKSNDEKLKDDKSLESFAIATSITTQYIKRIKEEHKELFFNTLYSHFTVYDSVEEFKEAIKQISMNQEDEIIEEIISLSKETLFYPDSFKLRIIGYMKEFLYALPHNRCIILAGKADTGKSFIIKLITQAINKILKDPELSKKYPTVIPYNIMDVFFKSDKPEKFYGYSYTDETGSSTAFGLLHSYVNKFEKMTDVEKFIRLNGPLDKESVRFIREMITSGDSPRIILNTMQTFSEDSKFHILIETDDISHLDPSIIGASKIIIFESINTRIPVSMSGAPSFDANLIFARVFNTQHIEVPSNALETMRAQFTEIMPLIIKYIVNIPNQVWSYPLSLFIDGGDLIIAEQLPFYSLYYAFMYINEAKADAGNPLHTKYILLHSIFLIFSVIVDQNSISTFDNWMRNHFLIKMPSDWVGFDVPQHFWDVFPRPTLLSVRFFEGKMIPLDYSLLNKPPIVVKHISQQNYNLTDDVAVCTAQFLPAIQEAKVLIKSKQNFILTGSNGSGKTNCIRYMFSDPDCGAYPIFIPVSANTTATELISFIKNHTQIMSKTTAKRTEETCALVFENVPPENVMALEFIRELATNTYLYQFSHLDPQYLDIMPLRNFFIIVTTKSIAKLSPRLSSIFISLRLIPLSVHSRKHIFSTVAQHFNITKEIYEPAFTFTEKCAQKPLVGFNFIHLLDIFCMIQNRTSPTRNDYLDLIRALLSEIKTLHAHKLTTSGEMQNFSSVFHVIFQDADVQLLYETVMNGSSLYYPEIEFSEETKSLVATFSFHQQHLIREELIFLLSQYASKTIPKPRINFFKPIIQQWVYLQRLLSYPGRNIMVVGPHGSGRFTLSAFTAITKGFEFVHITPRDKTESYEERSKYLTDILNDLIISITQTNKKFVVLFRADSETDFDYQFISPLLQHYNFLPFIKEEERKEIYAKIAAQYPQLLDDSYGIYEYLRYQIKIRVKFIIVSDKCFLKHYRNFQILNMEIETIELIENCASDAFQNTTFKKGLVDFSPNVPKAIATMYMNISSRFPLFVTNHYYDFINTFMFFFKNKVFDIEEHTENLKNALDFFEITKKTMNETKRKLDKLNPVLEDMTDTDENTFKAFAVKKDTIKARLIKIAQEEAQQIEQVRLLEDEVEKLKQELVSLNVKVELDRGKVEGISQQVLNSLRLIDGSHVKCVKYVIEMLLAFMGMKTVYEPYGRRLINDGKFIQNILNKIKGTEFNPKYLSNVSEYLEKLRPMKQEINSQNAALAIIYEWISDTYEACIIDSKAADRSNQLNGYKLQLKKFIEDSEIEKESIKQVEASLEEEMANYKKSIEDRECERGIYFQVKEKYKMLENLMSSTEGIIEKWQNDSINNTSKMDIIITDTILFSAFVVFFGVMTRTQQEEVMKEAFDIFETLGLQYNKDATIKDLYCALKLASDDEQLNFDNSSFFETELNWRRIKLILRPPLIIDSDGAMRAQILKSYKPEKIVQISTSSSNLESTIIKCMETGKKLLIYDVDVLFSDLFYLLQLPVNRDDIINFPIFDKVVKVKPKFTFFLFTSLRKLESIPSSITSRTTVINMSATSYDSISLIIARKFIESFDTDNTARIINIGRLGMQRAFELHKYEDEALDVISSVRMAIKDTDNYDLLYDPDTVDSVVRSKECYLFALAGNTDFESIKKEMAKITEPYAEYVKLCSSMWISLSRYLPRIKRCHLFLFDKFLEVIDNAIKDKLNYEEKDTKELILKHVMEYVFSQIPLDDSYVFLFISIVMARHTDKQFSGFEDIILHISDELYDVCDIRNSELTRSDPLEKLKFANISSIFPIIRSYLIEEIGENFEDNIPCIEYLHRYFDTANLPILIRTSRPKYLVSIIKSKMSNKNVVLVSLSCSSNLVKFIKDTAKKAIENGLVLVLFYSGTFLEARIVEDIYEMIVNPNKDFKLVILCSSFQALPQTILVGSIRINSDLFPSIRHVMFKIFNFNQSLVSGSSSPQLMKKLAFAIALNTALTKARQFFSPLGTYEVSHISEYVQIILEKTSKFIDKITSNEFPLCNIQEIYDTIVTGSMCLDAFDRVKLQEDTHCLLTNDCLEDTFKFRGNEWMVDREWDVPKIIEMTQSMPLIPTPEILGMDPITASPIFKWRLSCWIAKPISQMAKTIKILPADIRIKLESFSTMIPPAIKIPPDYQITTPLSLYLLNEINAFNKATHKISSQISEIIATRDDKVFSYIAKSRIPPNWKTIIGFNGTDNITKFFAMLYEKSQFLINWLKSPTTPKEMDIRFIRNIRGFFETYHTEVALKRRVPNESVKLQLSFDAKQENGIKLLNFVLMGANWDSQTSSIVKSNPKTESFTRIPFVSLVDSSFIESQPETNCSVPILKNIPTLGYTDNTSPYDNLISTVNVSSSLTQKELNLSGVAFICHIHDTFC